MFSFFLLFLQGITSKTLIVFDCGSTGTRAMIITYTNPDDVYDFNQSSENIDETYFYTKGRTRKLLDENQTVAAQNMDLIMDLFTGLNSKIPEDKRNEVPLIFLHTAGLRAMSVDQQDAINDLLFNKLATNETSKKYKIERKNFRVISGDEEALYQWMTVNQIYGYFNSDDTMPILSLGGESMQFAIELRNAPEDDFMKSFVYTIRIKDKYHYVFLYSWLNYGTTPLADLSHQNSYDPKHITPTPCMFENGNYNIWLSTVSDYVDIPGAGNFTHCKEMMWPIIEETKNTDKCEGYQPTVSDYTKDNCVPFADQFTKLYALSCVGDSFRYIPEIKNLNRPPKYSEFIEEITKFAQQNLEYVRNNNPEDKDDNAIWSISNAAMVSSFMEKAFKPHLGDGFNNLELHYESTHNKKLLAWNLGAAIAHESTGFLILEPTPYEESWWTAGRIAGVTIGIVAAVAIIIGVVIFMIIKKRNNNDSLSVGEQA